MKTWIFVPRRASMPALRLDESVIRKKKASWASPDPCPKSTVQGEESRRVQSEYYEGMAQEKPVDTHCANEDGSCKPRKQHGIRQNARTILIAPAKQVLRGEREMPRGIRNT
jgi:hypothetical protein